MVILVCSFQFINFRAAVGLFDFITERHVFIFLTQAVCNTLTHFHLYFIEKTCC